MLDFIHRSVAADPGRRGRIAIFPGAWNPPTVAHLAIAQAALEWADEVIWLLPRSFPHKSFEGATFLQRKEMLRRLVEGTPGFSAAVSEANLHIEMARETTRSCPANTEVGVICGRDAAERLATWDYGRPGVFEELLAEHPLLIASRHGEFVTPGKGFIRLNLPGKIAAAWDEVSSTEVRRLLATGGRWQDLVPEALWPLAASVYTAVT